MIFQLESNTAHNIIILSVFIALLHAGISVQEKKKKDLQLFCARHDACGTGSHTKQQHIIKNWISSPVFKIFM